MVEIPTLEGVIADFKSHNTPQIADDKIGRTYSTQWRFGLRKLASINHPHNASLSFRRSAARNAVMAGDSTEIRDRASDYIGALKGISDVHPFVTDSLPDGGMLVTCKLKINDEESWGWYYEKGDIRRAFFAPEELAQFISASTIQRTFLSRLSDAQPLELIKTTVVAVLSFIFSGAVIYIVIANPDNESLQVLTGLLGLTIGYLVGKGDQRQDA